MMRVKINNYNYNSTKFRFDQDPPNIVLNLDLINYTFDQFPPTQIFLSENHLSRKRKIENKLKQLPVLRAVSE